MRFRLLIADTGRPVGGNNIYILVKGHASSKEGAYLHSAYDTDQEGAVFLAALGFWPVSF